MKTFLAEVAERLMREHPADMDRVAVVFNNRRPSLFLRRQLMGLSDRPFFLPKMMGMDDIVSQISGLRIEKNEFLLFELYDIHRHMEETVHRYDTFEDFISFGEMMMADFSEIDLYCVDARRLLSNLHDLKAIGEWDVSNPVLTPFQRNYIAFYQSLFSYYERLKNRLRADGRAFGGMAYREACEVCERGEGIDSMMDSIGVDYVYFVGFNALSRSEQGIVRSFVRTGKGALITDGDAYYFDDPKQEAGAFLRRQAELFPVPDGAYPDHFAESEKRITLVSCPENILQTKYAARWLEERVASDASFSLDQTAVVLADEKLLVPMLNAIPDSVPSVNVTMGFPYSQTTVNTFVLKLIDLHLHCKEGRYHHQDVADVVSDVCLSGLLSRRVSRSMVASLLQQAHAVYADWPSLRSIFGTAIPEIENLSFLFENVADTPDAMLVLWDSCIRTLKQCETLKNSVMEYESLMCWSSLYDYFVSLQERYKYMDSLSVMQRLYDRIARRHNIAFIGEPLAGLQLLGMLETRNLDFKRVVLLSVNEGILPSGRSNNSLIPYNLKASFGIPTYRDKDAVYANHFYSLLQRAEEVVLVYNTDSDGMGKGEASRFVLQVRDELAGKYPNIHVFSRVVAAEHRDVVPSEDGVGEKTAAVMSKLHEIAERGLSPTALNLYRDCPLQFYYVYVLGLRELDDFSEDADASELGDCVHEVLQRAYEPDLGKGVKLETLQRALNSVDKDVEDWFTQHFGNEGATRGRNALFASVAKSQVRRFLESEKQRIATGEGLNVVALEYPMEYGLDIPVSDGETLTVKLIGKADRIDLIGNQVRVVDYKTGGVKQSDVEMTATKKKFPAKWFQVMFYGWLYRKNVKSDADLLTGLIPLRSYRNDFMCASWNGDSAISAALLDQFEQSVKEIVAEIMSPEMPFVATQGQCKYCPMRVVCDVRGDAKGAE